MARVSNTIPYDAAGANFFQAAELKESNAIGKRLAQARERTKMSQQTITDALENYGIHIVKSTLSRWESGEISPSILQFLALCDIYHIDDIAEYFLGRTIEPAEFSSDLNENGLAVLKSVKRALIASGQFVPVSHGNTANFAEAIEMRRMPVSDNLASAGTGNWLDDDHFTYIDVPVNQIPAGTDFGIRITGDSMEPIYTDHQIVWVQKCKELQPGEVGIFVYDGDGYIKQYHEEQPDAEEYDDYLCDGVLRPKVSLISFNENYQPKIISPYCRFEIIGRVLN